MQPRSATWQRCPFSHGPGWRHREHDGCASSSCGGLASREGRPRPLGRGRGRKGEERGRGDLPQVPFRYRRWDWRWWEHFVCQGLLFFVARSWAPLLMLSHFRCTLWRWGAWLRRDRGLSVRSRVRAPTESAVDGALGRLGACVRADFPACLQSCRRQHRAACRRA